MNFNFDLTLEELSVLEVILNKNIASYQMNVMKVIAGEDDFASVEYYEELMKYDQDLKNKIFDGVDKQLENHE